MPNQFLSPEGDLENYFVTEYWLIDQYIGDQLWLWGHQGYGGEIGNNTAVTSVITPVTTFSGGSNWKQISLGNGHSGGIKTDGTLWMWGYGFNGQLGHGITSSPAVRSTPITTFAGGNDWRQIALSGFSTFAIKTDGSLWCWGDNINIGINDTVNGNRSTPVTTFAGGNNWKQVEGGFFHVAAIKTDGTLWTWGAAFSGELGNGTTDVDAYTPITTFAGGTDWKQVSAGRGNTAAVKTDGTLWTWGFNGFNPDGSLGNNNGEPTSTPVTTFVGGTDWKQVVCGANHMLGIKTNGTLWSWGNSVYGQLGNGPLRIRYTPVTTFAGGTNWADTLTTEPEDLYTISSGSAIKTDGTLWTWGFGEKLGTNSTPTTVIYTPVTTFAGGTNWKQVHSSISSTLAIKTDGTLWAFGNNSNSQLGFFTSNIPFTPVTTFAGGTNWADTLTAEPEDLYTLSASNEHTIAIKTDGTLWVWGNGKNGRLGNGLTTTSAISTPITTFAGGTNWKQVSSSVSITSTFDNFATNSAIKTDGTLWTWGDGRFGLLGNADTTDRSTPITTFAGGTNWKQTSSGRFHIAAIKTDGTLWTWGLGTNSQLGNAVNNLSVTSTPLTTFAGGTDWKQVSAGGFHTAAIKTDGTLWVWGRMSYGSLGNALITGTRSTPVTTFAGGTNWKQVSSGNRHTAAIKTDGTLWVWGTTSNGRLGNTLIVGNRSTPITTFAGGTDWKQVSSGYAHTMAVKTDGTLWGWGNGLLGQLGNVLTANSSTPVTTFAGGTDWKQVSSGREHTVALKDNGVNKELFVWGNEYSGKIGNGFTSRRKAVFTPTTTFAGGTNWKQVSSQFNCGVAVKTDGTLWTWGVTTNGQLGNGVTVNSVVSTPVTTFAGGTNWKHVSNGAVHTAAIKTDGTLWVWGIGSSGHLGNADTTNKSTPVTTFAGGTNWKQVSAGDSITAAIKTDGTLWTWGSGNYGQLGNASLTNVSTPVTTFAGGTNWKQVCSQSNNLISIKTDGTLWTWGYNGYGFLGNKTLYASISNPNISTPVTTFAGGTNWRQVFTNNSSSFALRGDGINNELYVFGQNEDDTDLALGTPQNWSPKEVDGNATNWKQVGAGYGNTIAVKTDGTLWTWGYNSFGQVGNNFEQNYSNRFYSPVTTFAGGNNWKQVFFGRIHAAAIQSGISPDLPLS
jgi:YD repeat-containing protein